MKGEQHDTLLEIGDGVVVLEAQTAQIQELNGQMASLLGRDRDDLRGSSVGMLGDNEALTPTAIRERAETAREDGPVRFETTLLSTDDQHVPVSVTLTTTEENRILLTVRKRQTQTDDPPELELLKEQTGAGVWEWDLQTDEIVWDETCEALFGYEPGGFPGTEEVFADHVLDEDYQQARKEALRAIETGEPYAVDFRIERLDGQRRWIRSRGAVEYDGRGEPVRMVGVQIDITEDRQRSRELESYRQLFENTTDCVVEIEFVDGEPLINRVNAAFEEVFGYSQEDVIDENIHDVVTPDEHRERAMQIKRQYQRGEQPVVEVTRETADGYREFLMRAVNFNERFYYVIYTDITERKQREQKLKETKQQLEQSNEKLEQFAGVISHDLRSPLTAAQLRVDLMTEAADEHLEPLERNLDRMETMIDELLTMARAGQTVESTDTLTLSHLVARSWETTHTDGATLDSQIEEDLTIRADENRLRHVFENLFRNAVDHNEPPVTVRVGTVTDRENTVGFFVEDDGTGIPADERQNVRTHGYTTDEDGTGFGLAIVSDVIEAHGWELSITDSTNGGARFEITGVETSIWDG